MCRRSLLKTIKFLLVRIILILLTITLTFFLPLAFIAGSPIYFLRFLVKWAARLFNPELGNMVTTRGAPLAVDDFNSPTSTVCVALYLRSTSVPPAPFDINIMLKRSMARVVELRDDKGRLRYPETRQSISRWCLFNFWRWDKDFRIENHFRIYPTKEEVITESELLKYEQKLIEEPWHPQRSPWEGVLFPNYVDPQGREGSVIFCRFHHALADGYSIFKMTMQLFGDSTTSMQPLVQTKALSPKGSQPKWTIGQTLRFLIKVPYDLAKHTLIYCDWNNVLHPPMSKMTRRVQVGSAPAVQIELIKEIRKDFDVNFNSVLLTVLSGALRRWILKKATLNEKEDIGPKYIHVGIPLPSPNHPSKLRNFVTGGVIRLPVGIADPLERLKLIERSIQKLRESTFPRSAFFLLSMTGALPAPVIQKVLEYSNNSFISVAASFFPGPVDMIHFDGYDVVDVKYTGGLFRANLGILFTFMSYGGGVKLALSVDECLTDPGLDLNTIVKWAIEEIHILKELTYA